MTFILLSLTHPTEFGNLMRSEYQRGCVAWDEMNEVKGGHRLGLMSVQPRVLFINEKTYVHILSQDCHSLRRKDF